MSEIAAGADVPAWAARAADRSPTVQRSRVRSVERARQIVEAARRLIEVKGSSFTTQELVKEAGVAIQTFYKYFPGKDQVLLAVIEDLVSERCRALEAQAATLAGPIERLQFYLTAIISTIGARSTAGDGQPQFITTEHWRLHRLYPDELARANRPFADLLLPEIRAAAQAGLLAPANPEYDAWLVTLLVTAVYHHYEYANGAEPPEVIAERIWAFCSRGLGAPAAQAVRSRRHRRG